MKWEKLRSSFSMKNNRENPMGKKARFKKLIIILVITIAIISVAGIVLIYNANKIIKAQLESALGKDFSVQEIKLSWGKVEASNIRLKNKAGKEVFKTDRLTIQANFLGLLKKEFIISNLTLINPYVFMEMDKKGDIVNPSLPEEEGKDKKKKPIPPFLIKKVRIIKGSLDYLDRKPRHGPVLTRVRNINVEFHNITFPPGDNYSSFTIDAIISGAQGSGSVKSKGKIKLKSKDTESKIEMRNIDIVPFKPYFQDEDDVDITRGFLSLDMDLKVHARKLNAPGRAMLKDLDFKSGPGMGNKFLGVPLSLVIAFLKNSNNEITVDFVLEGDMDNPKYSLRESIIDKFSLATAGKLGISIKNIGKSIITTGADGVKKGVEGVKDIFKNDQGRE